MAPNPKKQESLPDDIDLLALIERGIVFIKKYRRLFLIAGLIGLSLGIWRSLALPGRYRSSLLVHPFILTNQEEIQIVGNWNDLLKKKEYATLSQVFNCGEDLLRDLIEIKADEIQKVFTPNNPNGFSVDVLVNTNAVLPALQQAILYGFENGSYVQQRIASKRSRITELMNKTAMDIRQLDSTRTIVGTILRGHANSSSSLIIDGSGLDRQWIDMNEKWLNLKEDLQFATAVQVLQGFHAFKHPVRTSWMVFVVIGLLVSLSLAYLFALFRELNLRLKSRAIIRDNP